MLRNVLLCVAMSLLAVVQGCGAGASETTPTARAIPSPVTVRSEPLGLLRLGDPTLRAQEGATTDVGRLGGSVYQIEIPDHWNGRLVLYLHGCCQQDVLNVETPDRELLIGKRFAWGASSFSSNFMFPGDAADETAALWDYFVAKHGRPSRTYALGISMGGAGALIAAERYADRFDGALSLCASDGAVPHIGDWFGDFFVAGAFAAGVTQEQFDTTEIRALINDAVISSLSKEPARRAQFEALYVALSGGPRPFAVEGLRIQEAILWGYARANVGDGVFDNRTVAYEIEGVPGVSTEQFNAGVIRVKSGGLRDFFYKQQELTGDIKIPVLALHATGDANNPLREEKSIRRRIEAAGKGDLLVQHAVRSAVHCELGAIHPALQALINWVELGQKPAGHDIFASDLSNLGSEPD